MEKTILSVIKEKYPSLVPSTKEALETYSHIELTQDEIDEAILEAKIKKHGKIMQEEENIRKNAVRRALTETKMSREQMRGYLLYRIAKESIPFIIDEASEPMFEVMLSYVLGDEDVFLKTIDQYKLGIDKLSYSINKGIAIVGSYGVGKSVLMGLFSRNQQQSYKVINARYVAESYKDSGNIDQFVTDAPLAAGDVVHFMQRSLGLCIDDIGAEDEKNNFGNKLNVIQDLIEKRYDKKNFGKNFHMTTNLGGKELREFYGHRVASRMHEMFNFFLYKGNDRRKVK